MYKPWLADVGHRSDLTNLLDIMQGETRVYEGAWQPLGSRAIRSDRKGTEAGGRIKLSLGPGVYTLRLTVKDAGSKQAVQQTTDFEVES